MNVFSPENQKKELQNPQNKLENPFCSDVPHIILKKLSVDKSYARMEDFFYKDRRKMGVPEYNEMMIRYLKANRIRKLFRLYEKMKASHIRPNLKTYNILIQSQVSKNHEEMLRFLKLLTEDGFVPDIVTHNAFLEHFLSQNLMQEAEERWNVILQSKLALVPKSYHLQFQYFAKINEPQKIFQMCNKQTFLDPDIYHFALSVLSEGENRAEIQKIVSLMDHLAISRSKKSKQLLMESLSPLELDEDGPSLDLSREPQSLEELLSLSKQPQHLE